MESVGTGNARISDEEALVANTIHPHLDISRRGLE